MATKLVISIESGIVSTQVIGYVDQSRVEIGTFLFFFFFSSSSFLSLPAQYTKLMQTPPFRRHNIFNTHCNTPSHRFITHTLNL